MLRCRQTKWGSVVYGVLIVCRVFLNVISGVAAKRIKRGGGVGNRSGAKSVQIEPRPSPIIKLLAVLQQIHPRPQFGPSGGVVDGDGVVAISGFVQHAADTDRSATPRHRHRRGASSGGEHRGQVAGVVPRASSAANEQLRRREFLRTATLLGMSASAAYAIAGGVTMGDLVPAARADMGTNE